MTRFIRLIIYQFSIIIVAVVNSGLEFKGFLPGILRDLRIKYVQTSGYNLKANSIIKAGHYAIKAVLVKSGLNWEKNLEYILIVDRTSIRASYRLSPF